jgi:hypothetical protein
VREELGLVVGEVVLVQRERAVDLECDEISDERLGGLGALLNIILDKDPSGRSANIHSTSDQEERER